MDALIQKLAEAGPVGVIAALAVTALAAIFGLVGWLVRMGWYWGFREPDKNTEDPGGWVTQAVKSAIENGDKLTEASVRIEQKLDVIARGGACRYPGQQPCESGVLR